MWFLFVVINTAVLTLNLCYCIHVAIFLFTAAVFIGSSKRFICSWGVKTFFIKKEKRKKKKKERKGGKEKGREKRKKERKGKWSSRDQVILTPYPPSHPELYPARQNSFPSEMMLVKCLTDQCSSVLTLGTVDRDLGGTWKRMGWGKRLEERTSSQEI